MIPNLVDCFTKTPSLCLSPQGERERSNYPLRIIQAFLSPLGEKDRVRGPFEAAGEAIKQVRYKATLRKFKEDGRWMTE